MKHNPFPRPQHLKIRSLALVLSAALLPLGQAQTLPSGLNVAAGQASVQVSGGQMTVTNSANAILNWQSFSIGAGNGVHFAQPSAASQVLNRVTGSDPSAILGSLSSNGRVWLLNPNGVLFGQGARVDVAGLVASTLNLGNQDWLAGRQVFSGGEAAAGVVNEGQLRTSLGGRVALLGASVENRGLIEAPGGQVVLAAGQSVELLDTGAPHLSVKVTAPQGEALNLGTLAAAGGRIDIHAAAVNQQGIVRADSLERGPAGEIVLKAAERVSLRAGSVTAADGETGGRVTLLGREVGLFDDASVSASGQWGGGEVLVGGGLQGRDASLPNAQAVFFGREASIRADAQQHGNGGRIILWSNAATRVYGALSARGGAAGGDGGFIETSGGWLDVRPRLLDVTAPHGQVGNWLLDPYDITITDAGYGGYGYDASFTATSNDAVLLSSTLNAALGTGAHITVSTGGAGGGSQAGTITLSGATIGGSSCESITCRLTLQADRDIVASGNASISGNFSQVRLRAGSTGTIVLENGSIDVTGQVLLEASSVRLESDAWVRSASSGDAIVISNGSGPVSSFQAFVTEGLPLHANNGRWVIWASDLAGEGFSAGGLVNDFTRYGATSPSAWAGDVGNGFVTDATRSVQVSGSANTRAYDGTRTATVGGLSYSVEGDSLNATLNSSAYALFDTKDVLTGPGNSAAAKPVYLYDDNNASPFQFTDSQNKPVYGLAVDTSIWGVIEPRQVSALMTAASRVYNAGTAATISVGSLSGLVGNETLNVTAQGQFSDKNVGIDKSVVVSGYQVADGSDGGLAQNYAVVVPLSLTASITPRSVLLSGVTAGSKVYDATTQATLLGTAAVTGVSGDALGVSAGQASFSDKNVGQGKAVALSGFTLTGADAGNYSLQLPTALTADVTPATLAIGGLGAGNKVYDGTRQASLGGIATIAPLGSDQVSLGGSAQALFSDANVGSAKPVLVSGFTLSGADAGNYRLQQPAGLSASITPATLRYVAQPLLVFAGDPLPAATGSVQGFLPGENQANATTGVLNFSLSAANSLAPAGSYGIVGGGLQAANYVLVQDPGNAQALVLAGPNPAAAQGQGGNATTVQAVQTVLPPAPARSPLSTGLLDLTLPPSALPVAPASTGGELFGSMDLDSLPADQLRGILAAREGYKRALFADALDRLAQNPALADLPPCASREELETGNCLITAALKRQLQAAPVPQVGVSAAPAPSPALAPAPVPLAPAAVPVAPAAPAPVASLFSKRRVVNAALPQIERKLALLIGVDQYADADIPRLGNAVADARAVAAMFEGRLGYETVVLPNAGRQALVSALNRLALELGPNDSVTLYYAGHGAVVDATGQGYWQLADSSAKRPESWLSNADIARLLGQLSASQVVLISDSCYSGTLVSGERIRTRPGTVDPDSVLSRRSLVVMSSGGNEPVFDNGKNGHSPFAWSLMNQLGSLGNWQVGGNVFERVRFAVARELPQRPQYGALAGHQSGGDYLFEQRQLDARP